MEQILGIIIFVGVMVNLIIWGKTWSKRDEFAQAVYITLMSELNQHYLCGHSVYSMIRANFFQRFGSFNHEGFCYTVSAAIALSLKKFHQVRIVRGHIKTDNFDSNHSWVEVRQLGFWFVLDPCFYEGGMVWRYHFYRRHKPRIKVIYRYRQIWQDPYAQQFYERMACAKTSQIFVDLYWHYTPYGQGIKIKDLRAPVDEGLLEPGMYYIFPPEYGFKFSRRIVDEFMARPTRRSPRRRTLRRLDSYYRRIKQNTSQSSAPA